MSLAADELILGLELDLEDVWRRGQTGGEGASTRLPRELRGHSWEHRQCRVRGLDTPFLGHGGTNK